MTPAGDSRPTCHPAVWELISFSIRAVACGDNKSGSAVYDISDIPPRRVVVVGQDYVALPVAIRGRRGRDVLPVTVAAITVRHVNRKTKTMEIWINPNCSKCHFALSLLDAEGVQYTLRYYLQAPPTALEIEDVLRRLGLEPWDIARVGEPVAVELGLATWPREEADRTRWIEALAAHPILIQRPIITADDGTAVVGRSPDSVRSVLPR